MTGKAVSDFLISGLLTWVSLHRQPNVLLVLLEPTTLDQLMLHVCSGAQCPPFEFLHFGHTSASFCIWNISFLPVFGRYFLDLE